MSRVSITILTFIGAFALFLIDGSALMSFVEKLEIKMARFGPDVSTGEQPDTSDRNAGAGEETGMLFAWSQVDTESRLIVRAIVSAGEECPWVKARNAYRRMSKRHPISAEQFAIMLCEVHLGSGDARELTGVARTQAGPIVQTLAPITGAPKSIVVLGDTGCRLAHYTAQECNDVFDWPFARVARLAAARKPDLVIHVGDYHYREAPCPDSKPGCAGAAWGDNWQVWRQDFFEPARPLLAAAPWVAIRGNHENCARAGAGWLHFLEPRIQQATERPRKCKAIVRRQELTFAALSLLVLDTADLTESLYKTDVPDFIQLCRDLGSYKRVAGSDKENPLRFILFHQPVYALGGETRTSKYLRENSDNSAQSIAVASPNKNEGKDKINDPAVTRARAFCEALVDNPDEPKPEEKLTFVVDTAIEKVLEDMSGAGERVVAVSGDTHNFQSVWWPHSPSGATAAGGGSGQLIHQIIVGNGGTDRDKIKLDIEENSASACPSQESGQFKCLKRTEGQPDRCGRANLRKNGVTKAVASAFGYMHLQKVGASGWRATVRNLEDGIVAVCGFPSAETPQDAIMSALESDGIPRRVMQQEGFDGQGCVALPG